MSALADNTRLLDTAETAVIADLVASAARLAGHARSSEDFTDTLDGDLDEILHAGLPLVALGTDRGLRAVGVAAGLLGDGLTARYGPRAPLYEMAVSRAVRALVCGGLAWDRPGALLVLARTPAHEAATLLGNRDLRHLRHFGDSSAETYTQHLGWLRARPWRADAGPLALDTNLELVFAEADLIDGCLVTADGRQAHSAAVGRDDRRAEDRLATRLNNPRQVGAMADLIGCPTAAARQQYADAYERLTPGDGWPRRRPLFKD